jgi:hypothetical protein
MLLQIAVRLNSQAQWKAAFADSHRDEFTGTSPKAAICSLFAASAARGVRPATLLAQRPDSRYRLNFTVFCVPT